MSVKIRVSRPARRDLDEIWFFIAQDSLDAADKFVDFLIDKFSLLASSPQMGRSREDLGHELRSFPVKNYLVLYRPLKGRIEIVSRPHRSRLESPLEVMFSGSAGSNPTTHYEAGVVGSPVL